MRIYNKNKRLEFMMKKALLRKSLVLALLLVPASMTAQETAEVVDTIDVEELADDSQSVTQYDLKECDWVDICIGNPRYAIVTKERKQGIYDLEQHKAVTDVEFRKVGFSRRTEGEDSTCISWFYAKKGIKQAIMGVFETDNSVFAIWGDDPEEVYSLDECTTIDKRMTKRARKLLESFIRKEQMDNAQIVIMDAKSGHLKTWIALDADMTKEDAGKLLAHSCSASLTIPFRGGKPLKNKRLNASSPFVMAVEYSCLAHDGKIFMPTLKDDSVKVDDAFPMSQIANLKEKLRVNRNISDEWSWLANGLECWGHATTDAIYAEDDKERATPIGKQIQFAGVFPIENPRYTICVVADKYSLDVTPAACKGIVNPMVRWLLKRKAD